MPVPKPRSGEEQDDFISRCHSAMHEEFPDQAQRTAVCFSAWRQAHPGSAPPPKAANEPTTRKAYVPFELKTIDLETREFAGLASTWDIDLDDERFEKGAFRRTISHWKTAKEPLPLIDQHNYRSVRNVFGKVIDMRETEHGLEINGKIIPTPDGDEYLARISGGFLNGLSVGFDTVKEKSENRMVGGEKREIRVITEAKLREVSAVIWGANPKAVIAAAKSLMGLLNDDEMEELLHTKEATEEPGEGEVAVEEEASKETPDVEPAAEPVAESEPEQQPTPEQKTLRKFESDLADLETEKAEALNAEDYHEAHILNDRIRGVKAKIKRYQRMVDGMKQDEPWEPDGKTRLATDALLMATLAKASRG